MTTPTAWIVFAALWLGCLHPRVWWLTLVGGAWATVAAGVPRRPRLRLAGLALAFVVVGSGLAGSRVALLERGPLPELARSGGEADMTATVVTDARPVPDGAWLLLRVADVDRRRSGHRALLRLSDTDDAPELGTRVRFRATARPLGHEGFDTYLRRLHVGVRVDPVSPLTPTAAPPRLLRATNVVRARTREVAARHLPPDHAALLSGLVTGDTTGLSEEARDALLASGLTHLVAVSGSNVAIVLAGTFALVAVLGVGPCGRRRAAVAAVLWFAVLVRGEPSVLRAVAMALLVLLAQASGRGSDARHTLAVAGLLLLLVDPLLAGQLGFVLSVLAAGGVLVVGPVVAQRIPGPRGLAAVVGATMGAQVAVAPVLLAQSGEVPVGSLPANLLAVPAAAAASAIGVVAAVVGQLWPSVAAVLSAAARPALAAILWTGRFFATAPVVRPQHLLTPVAGILIAALLLRRRLPWMAPAAAAVAIVAVVAGPWAGPAPVGTLTVTALDVGQGDAVLVEIPAASPWQTTRILVDAGADPSAALDGLRSRAINRLDAVVISHPHHDHTGGLPGVLSRIPTSALLTGPLPPAALDDPAASAAAAEAVALAKAVPVVRVGAGQQLRLGAAAVDVLSPPRDGTLGREPNDNSLVLRIRTGDGSVLLTGDVEVAAQQRLLRRPDLLRADVLKVPHHGGNTNAPGFLDAVAAHTAVIGVGAGNTFGHPHPDVLADLAGSRIVRTDTDGSISVPARITTPPR